MIIFTEPDGVELTNDAGYFAVKARDPDAGEVVFTGVPLGPLTVTVKRVRRAELAPGTQSMRFVLTDDQLNVGAEPKLRSDERLVVELRCPGELPRQSELTEHSEALFFSVPAGCSVGFAGEADVVPVQGDRMTLRWRPKPGH